MPKPRKLPPTPAAAEKLRDAMAGEIYLAGDYLETYLVVAKAANENPEALSWCPQFWPIAIKGLLELAVVRLSRVYDQDEKCLGLAGWIGLLSSEEFLPLIRKEQQPRLRELVEEGLQRDLRRVAASEPTVKKVLTYRHNFIAHRKSQLAWHDGPPRDHFYVKFDDMRALIARAQCIFNAWSGAAFGMEWHFGREDDDRATMAIDAMATYVQERNYRNNVELIGELMKWQGFD